MSTSATLDQKARAWSLLAAGTCLLPLLLQLPGLLDVGIGVVAALVLAATWKRPLPGWLRLLLSLVLVGAVLASARFQFGRDTACALLAAMLAIKPAETAGLRDARSLLGFALFAPFATFLLDQGPLPLLLGLLGATLALAALLRLAEVESGETTGAAAPLRPWHRLLSVWRLLAVGFLFMLARFSESFLILRGLDLGLSIALSPLALVLFNVGFLALAYPAGALSDSMNPRTILMAGIAVLIAGDFVLAADFGLAGLTIGVLLWGAHMALTQGIFARMIADSAPEHLRATSFGAFYFVTGIATLLASVAAGLIWDREGPAATFIASAAVAAVAWAMLSLLPSEPRRASA